MNGRKELLPQGFDGVVSRSIDGVGLRIDWATAEDGKHAARVAAGALCMARGWPEEGATSVGFHRALADPDCLLSRSHTANLGVLASASQGKLASIGVDVERADRRLRPGVERHFMNAEDDASWRDNLLRAWVAKEAAFKALTREPGSSALMGAPLILSGLWLREDYFGPKGQKQPYGRVAVEALPMAGEQVWLGLAVRWAT